MDYKLKNRDGVETTYTKEKLKIPAATGDGMVVFARGEAQAEKTVDITENGAFEVEPDAGFAFVKKVSGTVAVPIPEPVLQEKSVNIAKNGQTSVTPDAGKDGLSKVDITVAVPTPTPKLQKKSISITANGTGSVLPDAGKDGLSEVDYTVDVPTPTLVDKTVELSFPWNGESIHPSDMFIEPDQQGQAFRRVKVTPPSTMTSDNIRTGVNIGGMTGSYSGTRANTTYNPEGINFIDTDGTIAESWTLTQLQQADALPEVPEKSYGAKSMPCIYGGTQQPPYDNANIALTFAWNSTLAELKEANEPANVGLCYKCDYYNEGIKTYNIALAPHIVVLELPHAMDFTLYTGFRFWDNGLGQRVTTPTNTLSFPAAGKYCVQFLIRTKAEADRPMITEEMRPYVKSIIFPMADKGKMSIGKTNYYFKTDFGDNLMPNPYYKCPNIKTVAFSPRCGGAGKYEGSAEWDVNGFFLGCYSLETVSIPVAPNGYNGDGFIAETTFLRNKNNEAPYGAMAYNLKSIIVPKAVNERIALNNCIGGIESIIFSKFFNSPISNGLMEQNWFSLEQDYIVPWPNLKLIDLSKCNGLWDFNLLFGDGAEGYTRLKLPAGKSITIKVPASRLDAYKAADGWKDFADYIVGV